MSAGLILIDGYNLMHAAGMAQSDYRPGDLLRCRTRLLKFLLSKLTPAEIRGTTVVFDARDPPPDRPAQVVVSGIRVLFANPGGDADVLIQSWLARHPSPRRVTLVSSDRVLQRAARNCRAKFVGSEDFVHDLEQRRGAHAPKRGGSASTDESKPTAHASAEQTAYWLKVFGDVPIVEPDTENGPSLAAPSNAPVPKSQREAPPGRRSRASRKPEANEDSRRAGTVNSDELAYWMKVFGDSVHGGAAASAEELRLADLETWLKNVNTTEGEGPRKGK